jgi:4-alpha-glucanotransferase
VIVRKSKVKTIDSNNFEAGSMVSSFPGLRELAELVGVECEYVDGRDHSHQATDDILRLILSALGIDVQSESDIQQEWKRIQEERWTNIVEPVLVHYPEARIPLSVLISLPLGESSLESVLLECRVKDEQGKIRSSTVKGASCAGVEEAVIRSTRYVRIQVSLPGRLRLGYYKVMLTVKIGSRVLEAQTMVIAAPQRCYLPPGSKRELGLGVQLYGIRSRENWGIGDFRDLERIMKTAGKTWKASTIGLQPLHSLTPGLRSPYSPSSRLCWSLLYLNVEQVAEFRASPKVQRMFRTKKFQSTLETLRSSRLVEYEAVHQLKVTVLEDLFRVFKRRHFQPLTTRGRAFLRFVRQSPDFLTRFCTFQALSENFQGMIWREWPIDFQNPTSPAIVRFQKEHAARISYFYYVQWVCELQLTRLDQVAQKASLRLGLYHDLPVGIHPDGADAWGFQDQLARDVTSGAPPDTFNLRGQNWGLLAPNPRALRQHGYQFFRQTVRQNMKHGGVLRIDHALGLFRMFWVPFGHNGQDGLYVKTYVDEILAVLALESVRQKVMVVGEDLGTVTPAIQRKLEDAGLLSYRLLFFERDSGGGFQLPHQFPRQALVSATTHDLPTLKGYWAGRDMEIKEQASLYPHPEDRVRETQTRGEDRHQLWEALRRAGFTLPESMPAMLSAELVKIVYQFLARTPSRLLIVQLEDLLGELDTPNLPGAADSAYPSWRVRLSRELTSWLKDPDNIDFFQGVSRERRSRRVPGLTRLTKK